MACGDAGAGTLLGTNRGSQSSSGGPSLGFSGEDGGADLPVLLEGQDAAPPETKGEQLFRAMESALVTTCGGTGGACHVSGAFLGGQTPVWLGAPDAYLSAKKYPGIITSDPYASKLVIKGPHEGPGFTGPNAALGSQVLAWLTEEAVEIVAVQLPSTTAFAVQPGPNVVDISSGAAGISGAKISFVASVDGDNGILSLTHLAVQAPMGSGLHIAHPIFAVVPPTGPVAPDPVDSLSNVDQTVAPAESIALGTGILVLVELSQRRRARDPVQHPRARRHRRRRFGGTTAGGGRLQERPRLRRERGAGDSAEPVPQLPRLFERLWLLVARSHQGRNR